MQRRNLKDISSGAQARVRVFLALLALSFCGPVALAQEEQYRERQVLDPAAAEWVDQPGPLPGTPGGALEEARRLLAEGRPHDARRILQVWTRENPDHERYYEGLFLLAETHFETNSFYTAYKLYEQVIENSSGSLFHNGLRREMDVARAFLAGRRRLLWGFLLVPAHDEGIEILDRVYERAPGTRRGEEAVKLKADYYYARGDMEYAHDEYLTLAQQFPSGKWTRYAMLQSAAAANASFPGVKFDDRALVEAQERYRQVAEQFPDYAERENVDQIQAGIRERRAAKDLEVGKWYQKTGRNGAAEFYYHLILKDWPDTLAAAEARKRLRDIGVEVEPAATQAAEERPE